tara:strand:+ start:1 stop:1458 length:1458 start_codon:yes stop_codon:yes gene_type:complete
MLTALINVKAMAIAMKTQRVLMRALAGEQLAYDNQRARGAQQAEIDNDQQIADIQAKINKLKEKRKVELQNSTRQQVEFDASNMSYKQEIQNLERLKQEIIEEGVIKTSVANKDRVITNFIQTNKQKEFILQNRHNVAIQKENMQKKGVLIDTKLLGQHLQYENTHRVNVIQKIEEQIVALKEAKIFMAELHAEMQKGTMTQEQYEQKLKELTMALDKAGIKSEKTGHSFGKTNMGLMKMSMAAMGAQMGLSLLGPILLEDASAARLARLEMATMTVTTTLMMLEMIASIASISANSGAKVVNAGASGMAAKGNVKLSLSYKLLAIKANIASRAAGLFSITVSGGLALAGIAAAIIILDQLLKRYTKVGEEAKDAAMGVEDLNTNIADSAAGLNFDIPVEMDFSSATDSLQEFAGAREELFFGFKAGNVTGDLVKQVQQGGIENFVANTEIIMTNNFNGMTTDEAATQILDEIERGGRARGMTIA